MKMVNTNNSKHEKPGHSHTKHMWMMVVFCGVPLFGFLILGQVGFSVPTLGALLLLICAIGMIGMMAIMHSDTDKKESEHSAKQSEKGAGDETEV